MFALHTVVQFGAGGRQAAVTMLENELIPGIRHAPGFVRGTWFGDESMGHGVVLFESREQAEQSQQQALTTVTETMSVTESKVYQVDGEA
jgi:hypothetical protein